MTDQGRSGNDEHEISRFRKEQTSDSVVTALRNFLQKRESSGQGKETHPAGVGLLLRVSRPYVSLEQNFAGEHEVAVHLGASVRFVLLLFVLNQSATRKILSVTSGLALDDNHTKMN